MDPGIQPSDEHADLGAGQLMRGSDFNVDALALIQQRQRPHLLLESELALLQRGELRSSSLAVQGCLHQLLSLD